MIERCPYRCANPPRTGAREDQWCCGQVAGHLGSHLLYSADGERVLLTQGEWVLPEAALTDADVLPEAFSAIFPDARPDQIEAAVRLTLQYRPPEEN